MIAICKVCGPVRIIKKGMRVDNGKQKYGCSLLWISKKHGVLAVDVNKVLDVTQKSCDICGGANKLHVDHEHTTGVVRGLLCNTCNLGLGAFKDSSTLLESAIIYLSP